MQSVATRHARRHAMVSALLAALACLACGGAPVAIVTTGGTTSAPTCSSSSCTAGPGTHAVRVFVEPQAGATPIVQAIEGANTSIRLEVYILTSTSVMRALDDAARRGVDVRVLLDAAPYGEGSVSPQQTIERLNAAGVQAKPSDPAYHYTHEKAMVVDGSTAYIMTCNLSKSGLGGSSSATNREYGVIDTDRADVAEVSAIFQADWDRTTPQLTDPNLVVSPVDARSKLQGLIASAHQALQIEDEEMVDPQSESALVAAAQHGVLVDIVLPSPGSGASLSADVQRLLSGGVRVHFATGLYMHAKLIIADGSRAFVGSENFSANSLDDNREVGVVLSDPTALSILSSTFGTDWSTSTAA
jgi:cardiolipin synthase A/B